MVGELEEWGALRRRRDGRYVIGRQIWNLGLLAPVESGIAAVASPFLHDLYAATLATVHLAVRDGPQVLYLDRLNGRASVPVVSQVGSRLPMHATGVGKVMLAHAPAALSDAAIACAERITPYTIINAELLRAQFAEIRRLGYATTSEEMSLGACSIAVPVRCGTEVVASIGVVVPSLKRDRGRLVTALAVAAQGIGRSLT